MSSVVPLRLGIVLGQLDLGGAEGQALNLAAGLRRRGHDARAFSFLGGRRHPQAAALQVPCRVPSSPRGGLLALLDWLRHFRPDVVYTFTFGGNLWGRLMARVVGVPVIVAGYRQRRYYWFDGLTLGWARAVVCNCQAVADMAGERYGFIADRLRVIPNGVDLDNVPTPTDDGSADSGIDQQRPSIVLSARLHPNKDHETALRALNLVRRERPDVQLILLGEGPRLSELERLLARRGLESHVRLLGGRLAVAPALSAARLGWLSSRVEGSPNSVLEYMASGLPVVATRVGGVAELVRHGEDGFLCERGDFRSMARHTLAILSDPALREALGRSGRLRAAESFGMDRMVERTERLLLHLVAAAEPAGA